MVSAFVLGAVLLFAAVIGLPPALAVVGLLAIGLGGILRRHEALLRRTESLLIARPAIDRDRLLDEAARWINSFVAGAD